MSLKPYDGQTMSSSQLDQLYRDASHKGTSRDDRSAYEDYYREPWKGNGADPQYEEPEGKLADAFVLCKDFLAMDIPEQTRLCGPIFSDGLTIFSAPTGMGKSLFAQNIACAMHEGDDFCHWVTSKKVKTALMEIEMPGAVLQSRWAGNPPDLPVFNRHTMKAAKAGEFDLGNPHIYDQLIAWVIERRLECLVLDNHMSSTKPTAEAPMYSAELWQACRKLSLELIDNHCALVLIDHRSRSGNTQGSVVKEWQADTIGVFERIGTVSDKGFRVEIKFNPESGGKTRLGWEDKYHAEQIFDYSDTQGWGRGFRLGK